MNNISSFLERFKHLLSSNVALKQIITEILKEECGIGISSKEVRVSNGVLYVKVSPAHRSTLFMKKKKILSLLRERTGATIADIR